MTTLIVSDIHLGSSFNKVRELSVFIKSVSFSRLIILAISSINLVLKA